MGYYEAFIIQNPLFIKSPKGFDIDHFEMNLQLTINQQTASINTSQTQVHSNINLQFRKLLEIKVKSSISNFINN